MIKPFGFAVLWIWHPSEVSALSGALLHGSDNSRKPPLPVIQAMRFV